MIGCGTRGAEAVKPGMMCVLCVLCGVADGRIHAAVYRQSERARGVRAGAVGEGRGDQPGDGELCKLDGSALRGLLPGDPWEPCRVHMQLVGWLPSAWRRAWSRGGQSMFHLTGWGASG